MDKIAHYRQILQQIVAQHAELTPSHGQIETIPICDTVQDNYLLIDLGWNQTGRVFDVIFHLQIRNQKIWIHKDGIETGIAQDLLDAGISKDEIVLAFYRPERRTLTEFATA